MVLCWFWFKYLTGKLCWSIRPAPCPLLFTLGLQMINLPLPALTHIQLSSRADISSHANLVLMDRILTFYKVRDTRCSGDNKIQIGLFQRATQSRFGSWVSWQIICQSQFCVFPSWVLVQCAKDVNLLDVQSVTV